MTCIVGLVHDGVVYMGGDSGAFADYDFTTIPDGKVYRRGEFLIAGAGEGRLCDLVRYSFEPPPFEESETVEKYIVTRFMDALRTCLSSAGYARTENGQETYGGQLLVGVRGRLFQVYSNYCFDTDTRPYASIGTGGRYALGALYMTPDYGPEARVLNALEVAAAFNAGVRGPFTVLKSE